MPNTNYAKYHHARELSQSEVIANLANKIVFAPHGTKPTVPSGSVAEIYVEPHDLTIVEAGSRHTFASRGASKPCQWSLILSGEGAPHPLAASTDRVVFVHGSLTIEQFVAPSDFMFFDEATSSTPPAYVWGHSFKVHLPLLKPRTVERFRTLAHTWRQNRNSTGSMLDMCTHSAYQQIIGMGQEAIPLILRELEQSTDPWFWALAAITGANPVPEEHRGRRQLMVMDWLDWATTQGYRW